MKLCTSLLISFICFWNCSCQGRGVETGANNGATVQTSNVVANDNRNAYNEDATKGQSSSRKKLGNFRVDGYVDNELMTSSFFQDGLLVKEIRYNTQTKTQESEIEYFYTKDGKYDRVKVKSADGSKEAGSEADKYARDFIVQNEILKSKGIEFPLPDIVPDEVRDISNILSVADNYSDFKKETRNDGNQKIIKFVGFNKNVRFQPSTITVVVGNNPISIKDYELALENRYPSKELLRTDDGELTKTYSYKDGQLVGIVYKFTDKENQTFSQEKRFEYHELK